MKKSTDDLIKILKNKNSYDDFIRENSASMDDRSLTESLESLLVVNHISKADAISHSNLQRNYAYQIFSGQRIPSRDKLIMLCIGMNADQQQTSKLLLKIKAAPLYAKDERDSIILFGLMHHISVIDINILLYEHHLKCLE